MIHRRDSAAFTLIELLVVMAIVALLLTLAYPRYFHGFERSREAALKHDLHVMRDAIDKYHADLGVYPQSLDELANKRYLRRIPVDPITDRGDTWRTIPPPDDAGQNRVYDVFSGSEGTGLDGTRHDEW